MGIVLSKWRLSLAAGATAGMLAGASFWIEEREADQREADKQLAAGIARLEEEKRAAARELTHHGEKLESLVAQVSNAKDQAARSRLLRDFEGAGEPQRDARGSSLACSCAQGDPLCSCLGEEEEGAPNHRALNQGGARLDTVLAEAPIDPNGRFATTYRPGGGHLAAFEAAVARGIVPEAEREIVSAIGARYTPAVAVRDDRALAIQIDPERAMLAPMGGAFHLRIALQSTAKAPAERPHLSVHLALDVSGSMQGESIARAREAASALVDKLAASDDFSLVTFSSDAVVRVEGGPVGPRRKAIQERIGSLMTDGGTNIGAGLKLAYKQASRPSIPEDAVRVVLLVSDGRSNEGILNKSSLSRLALNAFQDGVQTSSLGLGSEFDGELMSSIASEGAGGYYYLRDAEQIAPALATELEKRLDPVATAVEVRIRLKDDIGLLRVYGSRRLSRAEEAATRAIEVAADKQAAARDGIAPNRSEEPEGGMRFFIPAFARGDGHSFLLKLEAPPGMDERALGLVELRFKDRVAKRNVTEEIPFSIGYEVSDAASAATADPSVARSIQGFSAGEALMDAADRIARRDRAGAVSVLAEREGILRAAAAELGEPLLLKDAERLSRLRSHMGSTAGVGNPLVLSMLLEAAGRTHLH